MKLSNHCWNGRHWLFLLGITLNLFFTNSEASEAQILIGKKAPTWELIDLDGKVVSSETFKGKVTILNFWATWCPPCRAEIPDFIKLQETYKDKNIAILGVSLDSGLGPVKRFVRTQKVNYPVLMGNGKLVAELGNFSAIPQTFIIDNEGRIHTQFQGLVKFEALKKKLDALLDGEIEK